jgi:hypothetical protein
MNYHFIYTSLYWLLLLHRGKFPVGNIAEIYQKWPEYRTFLWLLFSSWSALEVATYLAVGNDLTDTKNYLIVMFKEFNMNI